jgi:hypothetical protein
MDLFVSEQDLESLAGVVLSNEGLLVPDMRYSAPVYSEIADIPTLRKVRPEARLFFVLHKSYLVTPLEMRCFSGEGTAMWYIVQRNGGPSIDIFCPGQVETASSKIIGQGYMGYHPTFWNPSTARNEQPPPALKQMYALLQRHIKQHATRVTLAKRTFWIGQDAVRLSRLGWRLHGLPADRVPA